MSNQALYRKYRPERFEDIRGQEHVTNVLASALESNDVSHAYLFAGKRGTGKTSVARILAKELGCGERDMYEMDAASNRRIADVRELREAVRSLPYDADYKVYIIDEVHMLTTEAFNALLKTLEEPPEHAIFILATTEPDQLPDTVISRCEVHNFKQPRQEMLAEMVTDIVKNEEYEITQPAAELLGLIGDGSFRDTLGALQKVIRSADTKEITTEVVQAVTGAPKSGVVNAVLQAIAKEDVEAGLKVLRKAVANNIDMALLMELLLRRIRMVLLLRHAPDMQSDIQASTSEDDFQLLQQLANESVAITSRTLKRLLEAYNSQDHASLPQMPLEVALMDLAGEDVTNTKKSL